MRRDFGHVNQNHAPVGGYQQPHFISERGNHPIPRLPVPYQFAKTLLAEEVFVEHEAETDPENEFAGMGLGNPELPIADAREIYTEAIKNNKIVILTADLGSGKSTQTPQMALEAGFNVVQTQPRRIAAYGVADRIEHELAERLGPDRAKQLVGHRTAESSTVTEGTRITVQTDGIEAAQQLNEMKFSGSEHHILDEVHEWNTNLEVTIAIAKKKLLEDPNASFTITSGTMPAHELADYFSEATGKITPVIEVAGRSFPLEKLEKADSTVAAEALLSLEEQPDEDILIFVAGKREIADTIDAIQAQLPASLRDKVMVMPLHAKLTKEEQAQINHPSSKRKIIVSTNVAQTSLTIPGVGVVIDSGQERHVELDDEGVEGLGVYPASQADCDQRAGRTARIAPGKYILTRYDANAEFVPYIKRPKYGRAEILRTDIDRTILRTAAVDIDFAGLDLFHPVDPAVIERSKQALYTLGALDQNGNITALGKHMNKYPVRPSSARMLCEVASASPMVRAQMAAITASLEAGGLPYFAHDAGNAWKQLTDEKSSDLFAQLDLFIASQNMTDAELKTHDLDVQNIRRAQEQYRKILRISNTEITQLLPANEEEREELKRAIYAGLIDWVYAYAGEGQYERMSQSADYTARELSRRSVVNGQHRLVVGNPYRVEFMRGGLPNTVHIIENVTVVDNPRILGSVAASHLVSWEPAKKTWRDGRLVELMRRTFNRTVYLGEDKEVAADSTPENRQFMLSALLENPGPAQQKLRVVKKELEELNHLTRNDVPQLTQDSLIALLAEAIADGPLEQSRVDNRLREIVQERGITLDSFITSADRQDIIDNAPVSIQIGESQLHVTYRHGFPVVTKYSTDDLPEYPDRVVLPDGREVLFVYERRAIPIGELRSKLMSSREPMSALASAANTY